MQDTFDLHIDLGNDAMRSQADVADVIQRLARTIKIGSGEGKIRDLNGNTVGHYGFDLKPETETREKTDLEHAFDAASYKAAQAVIGNKPEVAREFANAAAAIGAAINGPRIDQLELHDGDTLIVHLEVPVDRKFHDELKEQIHETVAADVRVLVFAAGSRLAGVAFGARA